MASASSLAHFNSADKEKGFETVEMDPQYATGLGLDQGDIVRTYILPICEVCLTCSRFARSRLGCCTTYQPRNQLELNPYPRMTGKLLSVHQYLYFCSLGNLHIAYASRLFTSMQEIHASHVENTLLSQVRVANIGQEIDIWILGRTRVRLRVGK